MGLFTLDRDLLPENWGKTRPSGKPVLGEPPEVRPREPVYLVTDTSWWMEDGWRIATEVAERLRDGEPFFVVPAGVMRELDGLKKNPEKGKRALEATKRIHELVSMGRARIVRGNGSVKGVLSSPVDEEVLSVAEEWKEKGKTYLLTTDRAQMAVGEVIEVKATRYDKSNKTNDNKYISSKSNSPKKSIFDKDVFYVMFCLFSFIFFLIAVATKEIEVFIGGILLSVFFALCGAFYPILLPLQKHNNSDGFKVYEEAHGPGCGCGSCQSIYE